MSILKTTNNFSNGRKFINRAAELFSTELGIGRAPRYFSRLIGSVPGIALFYLTNRLGPWAQVGCFFFFILLTVWAANQYIKSGTNRVSDEIVADSALGMWAALFFLWDTGFLSVLAAFASYRCFAVLKPFPINLFQTFKGGIGIAADDLASGMAANIIVRFLLYRGII